MSKKPIVSFADFMAAFPPLDLPITLTEETKFTFSTQNQPFSGPMLDQYLIPLEQDTHDEFTEYLPCFSIPDTHTFHAVVYWKATLMNYQYVLVTFSNKAELIDKKVIAGTFSDGESLIQSVATIDPDWEINIISGKTPAHAKVHLGAAESTTQILELLPEGQIVTL